MENTTEWPALNADLCDRQRHRLVALPQSCTLQYTDSFHITPRLFYNSYDSQLVNANALVSGRVSARPPRTDFATS